MSIRIHLLKIPDNVLAHAAGKSSNSFLDWLTEPWIPLATFNYIEMPKSAVYNELCILRSAPLSMDLGHATFIIIHTQYSKQVIHFIIKKVEQWLHTLGITGLAICLNCPEAAGLIGWLVTDLVTDERQYPLRLSTVLEDAIKI